jgi:hypothetical protein
MHACNAITVIHMKSRVGLCEISQVMLQNRDLIQLYITVMKQVAF